MASHGDMEEQPRAARRSRRTALGVLAGATAVTAVASFLALSTLGGQDEAREVVALELEAVDQGTTVGLRWSPYTGAGFATYLLLRADPPQQARYPVDAHTTVVARIPDPKTLRYFDSVREPAGRSYRVVAVDDGRRLLARSPAVEPATASRD